MYIHKKIRKDMISMKITLPESAVKDVKRHLTRQSRQTSNYKSLFRRHRLRRSSFGIALDEQKDSDVAYEVDGLQFIMDKNEYAQHGDIVIEDTGYGFRVIPESMKNDQGGCGGGCSGCGH